MLRLGVFHAKCGGTVESDLRYSDGDRDYYFQVCRKCQQCVDLKDIEFTKDEARGPM